MTTRSSTSSSSRRLVLGAALAAILLLTTIGSATPRASAPAGLSSDEILPPEQAYPVHPEIDDQGRLSLVWEIAPGYYLYRTRFDLEAKSPGLALGPARFPAGKMKDDQFFGPMEIYRGRLVVPIPIEALGEGPIATIAARMQGCGDMGICFPPNVAAVDFDARAIEVAGRAPPDDPGARAWLASDPITQAREAPSDRVPASSPRSTPAPDSILDTAASALREAFGAGTPSFLPVEQAFVISAERTAPATLEVRFDIAEGYYLYRDKTGFAVYAATEADPEGIELELTEVTLPAGAVHDDEYFGRVETYRERVDATVRLAAPAGQAPDGSMRVRVKYQGCADAGLCYPPSEKVLVIAAGETTALAGAAGSGPGGGSNAGASIAGASSTASGPPAAGGAALTPSGSAPTLSETDRIVRTLAGGNVWLIIGAFYVFGLLLSFTPCVLPMVPILSSILVGQDTGAKRTLFGLSLAYVLAMALTYAAAGVIAGKLGENLQAAFQHPAVLIAFVLVFIALAASMFGLYELQLPSSWQSRLATLSGRQRGGSYLGAAVMGLFSALIVGPCVAAPLAAALVYIGQTGDAVLGAVALFTLALGMGTPLLVIGASAGSLLPKVGPWMEAIKRVFGFVLLGVAIYLLERLLPAPFILALWAVLFIVAGVFAGGLDAIDSAASAWQRLWKGTGLALLSYGILLGVGAALGGDDVLRPLRTLALGQGERTELAFRPVKGIEGPNGLEAAVRLARVNRQPMMLEYYADWCVTCKELERNTFRDPGVQAALGGVSLVRADVTANDANDAALLARFGLYGPPAILFFDLEGNEQRQFRVIGYMDPERFRAHVAQALGAVGLAGR